MLSKACPSEQSGRGLALERASIRDASTVAEQRQDRTHLVGRAFAELSRTTRYRFEHCLLSHPYTSCSQSRQRMVHHRFLVFPMDYSGILLSRTAANYVVIIDRSVMRPAINHDLSRCYARARLTIVRAFPAFRIRKFRCVADSDEVAPAYRDDRAPGIPT